MWLRRQYTQAWLTLRRFFLPSPLLSAVLVPFASDAFRLGEACVVSGFEAVVAGAFELLALAGDADGAPFCAADCGVSEEALAIDCRSRFVSGEAMICYAICATRTCTVDDMSASQQPGSAGSLTYSTTTHHSADVYG